MKNNACTARKEGMCYQPEPKVPVTLSENKEKKNATMVMNPLTWEMQQGRVIRVSTEIS